MEISVTAASRKAWLSNLIYIAMRERANSTGLYIGGAAPTVPAISLAGTGINLHSGDIFNVQITYSGTVLTVVITDTKTNASATQSYTINIPSTVGGPTAYMGFTGGDGGATAIQNILSWTYSPTYTAPPAVPNFSTGFGSTAGLTLNGGAVSERNQASVDRRGRI